MHKRERTCKDYIKVSVINRIHGCKPNRKNFPSEYLWIYNQGVRSENELPNKDCNLGDSLKIRHNLYMHEQGGNILTLRFIGPVLT